MPNASELARQEEEQQVLASFSTAELKAEIQRREPTFRESDMVPSVTRENPLAIERAAQNGERF